MILTTLYMVLIRCNCTFMVQLSFIQLEMLRSPMTRLIFLDSRASDDRLGESETYVRQGQIPYSKTTPPIIRVCTCRKEIGRKPSLALGNEG